MKRISLLVVGVHFLLLCWMALWMPASKIPKKPMAIRTVRETRAPAPAVQPVVARPAPVTPALSKSKPVPIKKPAAKPAPRMQKPIVPTALLKQLESSMAKLEAGANLAPAPKSTAPPKLQIDEANASIYASDLIQCLQSALTLPSIGAIKVELTLQKDGSFLKMRVLESKSSQNKLFLETHLASMNYPPFNGELKNQQEHSFVITFCNY